MNYLFLIITLAVIVAILCIAAFSKFKLSNEGYDRLKAVVIKWQYIVVFVALIVKTFDVPYGIETVTIVSGFGAMLAGLMGISTKAYRADKEQDNFNDDADDMLEVEADEDTEDATEE